MGSHSKMNPRAFLLAGDLLVDCATHEAAVFSIAIFNRGALATSELDDLTAFEGDLRLTKNDGDVSVPLVQFRFPELPRESQLQWQGGSERICCCNLGCIE